MFDEQVIAEITQIAERLDVPPAALLAVAEVESGGRALAKIGSRREPLIRFEGHYFDRLLGSGKRHEARALGLASPKAGAIKNPTHASWSMETVGEGRRHRPCRCLFLRQLGAWSGHGVSLVLVGLWQRGCARGRRPVRCGGSGGADGALYRQGRFMRGFTGGGFPHICTALQRAGLCEEPL